MALALVGLSSAVRMALSLYNVEDPFDRLSTSAMNNPRVSEKLQPELAAAESPSPTQHVLELMLQDLLSPVDRAEMWVAFPQFLDSLPDFPRAAADARRCSPHLPHGRRVALEVVLGMCEAHEGRLGVALERLTALAIVENQSPMVQGALFHLHGLADPTNPKFRLEGRFCTKPFEELHVLEASSHLCCASWLSASAGDLGATDWRDVWNSESAQAVRASIHDGSFRHCNKTACPFIQEGNLPKAEAVARRSDDWARLLADKETAVKSGPADVNLAYDRTCNLSCPSCRTEKIAADEATRRRYDTLQERNILPMLREAKTVFITGSGDPFASKNFRQLMERLTPEDYPELRFRMMTNGMLFTQREWDRFPALHGRVHTMHISIDGASQETHELLRRGARWNVMEANLRFAADLLHQGLIEQLHLSFTVQVDNYREMGLACDLAEVLDVTGIYFGRLTNWGTFSPEDYAQRAVFTPGHPLHDDFLVAMADPRLRSSRVVLGNMAEYLPQVTAAAA